MSDSLKERGQALENEYFRRQERELIEKMKAKMTSEATSVAALNCPKCDGKLVEVAFEKIQIDACNKCGGVWLDPGELEQITRKENEGWFNRLLG